MLTKFYWLQTDYIFNLRWLFSIFGDSQGERLPPSLYCLSHQEEQVQLPLEIVGSWWVRSGRVQVTLVLFWGNAHLESCKDCWQPSCWAALGTAGPFLALHHLLLFHVPVAGMTCCEAQSQTSHHWCPTLSRPRANSLLKWLSYFSSSRSNVVAQRQRKKLWSPLQQYLAFSRQQTWAASCVSYKIRLASNFKLGVLPWLRKGEKFFVLA